VLESIATPSELQATLWAMAILVPVYIIGIKGRRNEQAPARAHSRITLPQSFKSFTLAESIFSRISPLHSNSGLRTKSIHDLPVSWSSHCSITNGVNIVMGHNDLQSCEAFVKCVSASILTLEFGICIAIVRI
jgi:hypothetical protein